MNQPVKYYALQRANGAVLTTVEVDAPNAMQIIQEQKGYWGRYLDDQLTIVKLSRRAQAAQKSVHGHTEARGWETTNAAA